MGAMGYGLSIHTANGSFCFLKDLPTLIGNTNFEKIVEVSKDGRYLRVTAPDVTYILDSESMKVSIFRITVRAAVIGQDGVKEGIVYTTENCVFGRDQEHLSAFTVPIYLQCPWVGQDRIQDLVGRYRSLREKQLAAALNLSCNSEGLHSGTESAGEGENE